MILLRKIQQITLIALNEPYIFLPFMPGRITSVRKKIYLTIEFFYQPETLFGIADSKDTDSHQHR